MISCVGGGIQGGQGPQQELGKETEKTKFTRVKKQPPPIVFENMVLLFFFVPLHSFCASGLESVGFFGFLSHFHEASPDSPPPPIVSENMV